MAVWGAVMGGVNLLYQGAGWLEGGLTASYEKLIIDAEILQMMAEVLQPIVVDEASLGFEAIAEVGPGGHFFGTAHTLERYETAFYQPIVSDWRNFETWQADGARTATERANTIWKRLLAEAVPPPLDPAVAPSSTPSSPAGSARSNAVADRPQAGPGCAAAHRGRMMLSRTSPVSSPRRHRPSNPLRATCRSLRVQDGGEDGDRGEPMPTLVGSSPATADPAGDRWTADPSTRLLVDGLRPRTGGGCHPCGRRGRPEPGPGGRPAVAREAAFDDDLGRVDPRHRGLGQPAAGRAVGGPLASAPPSVVGRMTSVPRWPEQA